MIAALALVPAATAALAPGTSAPAVVGPVVWCGTDQAASDRLPDGSHGFEWHVVYAFASDGADNFAGAASGIATDLANVDVWWNGQDPSRRIRFDTFPFEGCTPGFSQLDISRAQLPHETAFFAPLAGRLDRLVADLNAPPFNFANADKKYLVFYDGAVDVTETCGEGNSGLVDGGPQAFAVVFLGACGQALGSGEGTAAITAAHEMVHGMNALPFPFPTPGPPHACSSEDRGHPCDHVDDLLYPTGTEGETLSSKILDAGRDDYYGHPGPWWNGQNSLFLVRAGGDETAPLGPSKLTPTSLGTVVTLTWKGASDAAGPVSYRLYKGGRLVGETSETTTRDRGRIGETIVYGVRAVDAAGNLGPLVEARFEVGLGIVDEAGGLVSDTVAPPPVAVRGRVGAASLELRWKAVKDPGGIKGYLVLRNGKRFKVVSGTTISIPRDRAKGTWTVRAVDRSGNVGVPANKLRVR